MSLLETVTSLAKAGFTKEEILKFASHPVAQPVAHPVTQPVAQPVTQPVAQPVTQPVTQPDMTQFMQELYRQGAQIDIPTPPQKDAYNVLGEALASYYSISGNHPGGAQ